LGVVIGTDVQAQNARLQDIATNLSATSGTIEKTATNTFGTYTVTTAGKALIDDADNTAQRATLGLVIGTNVQAFDAELAAIAGLTSAADRLPYFTGSGTASLATFTSFARSIVDDADAATVRTTLGLGGLAIQDSIVRQGLTNIAFKQGADSSQLTITSANGSALSASNPGYVRIRTTTAGTDVTFTVTADVTIDLTGSHWGYDTRGDVTGTVLRVYAINNNGALAWGVCLQAGFSYIRNTQDVTSSAGSSEIVLTNVAVTVDNQPMQEVGYIRANFTDATNEWAITEYHADELADGLWQPWNPTRSGFSAAAEPFKNSLKAIFYPTNLIN